MSVSAPLSIAPDQLWYGNDGPWSAFLLGYGTPVQYIKSYISTSTPQPYVVLPQGCTPSDPGDCSTARGNLFLSNVSTTWQDLGLFTLAFEENLGIYENGDFAFDSVQLGIPGSGAPLMVHQIVVGIAAKQFFLGTLGLRPAPTNLTETNVTDLSHPIPSLMQNLKDGGKIPSLSWGYTAGAYYQSRVNKDGGPSLTLGGYDASRFQASNSTFNFAPDTSRDLVVAIRTILTAEGSISLLQDPILSFIDSAVSHIWLPVEACQMFARTFNLTYDNDLDLYLVNETVHEALLAQNATISLTLSNDLTLGADDDLVVIDMPYSSFDLQLTPDYPGNSKNTTLYFPIRQAANESQYTLGRAFLQEAYVIADYERSTFSVHQALFPGGNTKQSLQTIPPVSGNNGTNSTASPTPANNGSGSNLSTGALAGIIIGCIAISIAFIIGGYCIYRRMKNRLREESGPLRITMDTPKQELDSSKLHVDMIAQELPGHGAPTPELPGKAFTPELAGHDAELESPSVRLQMRHGSGPSSSGERWEMLG